MIYNSVTYTRIKDTIVKINKAHKHHNTDIIAVHQPYK